ncbi:MAG: ribonuclease P protein component [Chromatiales bacterium]|nr:ribonuclease P protein component [Chromatiales bacterium]MDX9767027.1 ribonuclease P protein component [Ectothiorhodospiraceae bacterium]
MRSEGGFPRSARLTCAADFQRVFGRELGEPIRSSDANFTLLARRNEQGAARLGLAISRRNVPRSVDRQRIKRLARESFRRHRAVLPAIDIVVTCRAGALTLDNAAIYKTLESHWQRLTKRCAGSSSS